MAYYAVKTILLLLQKPDALTSRSGCYLALFSTAIRGSY